MAQSEDSREEQLVLLNLPRADESEPEIASLPHPIWTEKKARLIERYLYYFVFITHHGTYIDGFAGPQRENHEDMWSARLVLNTEPRWLRHFHLFDADPEQVERLRELQRMELNRAGAAEEKPRDIRVYEGDFNEQVGKLLASGEIGEKEATFCLLDQRTFECRWSTVKALAAHKRDVHKIEIFYFLPHAWLDRALSAQKDLDVVQNWWGRDDWNRLRDIPPNQRVEIVVERFKHEFKYRSVKPWPIYGRGHGGPLMYHMIHATDHPVAPDLMRRAYVAAVTDAPREQLRLDLNIPIVEGDGSETDSAQLGRRAG